MHNRRHALEAPGNAEPQLDTYVAPGNAEPQLGVGVAPGNAEPQLGTSLSAPKSPPAWRSRGYLPHFDTPDVWQSITFRLADSLPRTRLAALEKELSTLPPEPAGVERRKKIEEWMDAGMGCCALRHPKVAAMVQETLLKHDRKRYRLLAWCIMPNHVHALIEANESLGKIVQSWKSFTGRWVLQKNAELGLGVPGKAFWMREYWDRYIRDRNHFIAMLDYIHRNPVDAGLCETAAEWPWSSAGLISNNFPFGRCVGDRTKGLSNGRNSNDRRGPDRLRLRNHGAARRAMGRVGL